MCKSKQSKPIKKEDTTKSLKNLYQTCKAKKETLLSCHSSKTNEPHQNSNCFDLVPYLEVQVETQSPQTRTSREMPENPTTEGLCCSLLLKTDTPRAYMSKIEPTLTIEDPSNI